MWAQKITDQFENRKQKEYMFTTLGPCRLQGYKVFVMSYHISYKALKH